MKILAFGIAKDIIGGAFLEKEDAPNQTVLALKKELLANYPQFGKLATLSIAVNNEYAEDDYLLQKGDEVVIIPPVSGG